MCVVWVVGGVRWVGRRCTMAKRGWKGKVSGEEGELVWGEVGEISVP